MFDKRMFTTILIGAILAVLFVLAMIVGGLYVRQYVMTRNAAIDTSVYRHSSAYIAGKATTLEQYREAWETGDAKQRIAIRDMVREQYASFPVRYLNPSLRNFLSRMEQ